MIYRHSPAAPATVSMPATSLQPTSAALQVHAELAAEAWKPEPVASRPGGVPPRTVSYARTRINKPAIPQLPDFNREVREFEGKLARQALAACGNNLRTAARAIGISRATFYRILHRTASEARC